MSGALTGDVASMGSPLTGNGVLRAHDPDGTSLVVGPSPLQATAESNRPTLPAPAHTCVLYQDLVWQRPGRPFAPCWRLPRSQPELAFVMLRYVSPNLASLVASPQPSLSPRSSARGRAGHLPSRRRLPQFHRQARECTSALPWPDRKETAKAGAPTPPLTLPLRGSEIAVCSELTRDSSGKRKKEQGFEYPPARQTKAS
jgi:hypothetical protein